MLLFVFLLFSSKHLKICKVSRAAFTQMSSISTAGFSGSRRCLQTCFDVCILTGLFFNFFSVVETELCGSAGGGGGGVKERVFILRKNCKLQGPCIFYQ